MTHEPECTVIREISLGKVTSNGLYVHESGCVCDQLRAAYKRGRDKATRAIAEVVHDTIVSKKFVAGGLSDLPDLLTAIYYAGGGEQE